MNIEDVDFERLIKDIAIKHFDIPGSPTIAAVIHYCLFSEISASDLAIKCQDILLDMGYTSNDLLWKRRNDGEMCERLFDKLELDFEFDGDHLFYITNRKYPNCGVLTFSTGTSIPQPESKWTRTIDFLYELKLNKRSWLYGYTYCNACLDNVEENCDECGGTGRAKCDGS